MLYQFMNGTNHLIATFVTANVAKKTFDAHVTYAHEGKKKQRQRNGSYQSQKKF